ncbi:TetR/AcrR family transcriptional regulator [Aquabacterium sp.]|uniref:TetR/AcrR family transcriptional regulator n=1 Tax=Aquabacterium sp. TaxID=1872578 RepID=UPI0025C452A6|nr:TetR/AcrR family transcriptional regulator [Aquabacterium sp.]
MLAAATHVFMTHGFSAATTDMIQAQAKVSKATVYARYANKEALFLAVIEHQCQLFDAQLQALQPVEGDLEVSLAELGRAYLDLVLSPQAIALFRVVVAEAPRFPHIGKTFYAKGPRVIHSQIRRTLERAADHQELDLSKIGVDMATGHFLGMLRHEAQMESLTHPEAVASEMQRDTWARAAVSTLLRAYGARVKKPPRDTTTRNGNRT